MKKRILFIIMCCLFLCSCSSKNDDSISSGSNSNESPTPAVTEKSTKKIDYTNEVTDDGQAVFDKLFNLDNFVSVEIHIKDEELAKIQKDYETYKQKNSKSPIYRIADKVTITVGGEKYELEEVGVRMKGNTSRSDFYNEQNGVYNIINLRLSFSETFDKEEYYGTDAKVWESDEARTARKHRTFALMDSINLKYNVCNDSTHMNEYYVMSMFRDFDVLAAHNCPSVLKVAGKSWGVFTLFEPVDKYFLDKNLDEADLDGDLYKGAWAGETPASYELSCTYGINDPDLGQEYSFDLKTNKKSSSHESLTNLLSVLNNSALNKESFASVMDTDYFVNFTAVSYFAGSPDDIMYNFNNHFIYFLKGSNKAVIIPYDYDISFGVCSNWNPFGDSMTSIDPFYMITKGSWSPQLNPMYAKGLNDDFYKSEYLDALKKVAESKWLNPDTYEEYYNKVKANYENYLMPDIEFNNISASSYKFEFDYDIEHGNKSPVQYMKEKLETYNNSIK